MDDELDCEELINSFVLDPNWEQKEAEWDEIKQEIVGDYFDQVNQQDESQENSENEDAAVSCLD